MMKRKRLDVLLVEKGLVDSRAKAQGYIRQGLIRVGSKVVDKPGTRIRPDADIAFVREPERYVGRGAKKLAPALDAFGIDPAGRVCLDIGASTGGFTQVLLERGAARVYAVDVGYGQLVPVLRADPRVVVMERTNARRLAREDVPEPVSLVTMDVSFISTRLIFPALAGLRLNGDVLVLVKPQFELSRREVPRGGVVRAPESWEKALRSVIAAGASHGFGPRDVTPSPLPGTRGNREFFVHFIFPAPREAPPPSLELRIRAAVSVALRETSTP